MSLDFARVGGIGPPNIREDSCEEYSKSTVWNISEKERGEVK
jgi:hypothetical protein